MTSWLCPNESYIDLNHVLKPCRCLYSILIVTCRPYSGLIIVFLLLNCKISLWRDTFTTVNTVYRRHAPLLPQRQWTQRQGKCDSPLILKTREEPNVMEGILRNYLRALLGADFQVWKWQMSVIQEVSRCVPGLAHTITDLDTVHWICPL